MNALNEHIARDGFRLRGVAMSRIDGFSDVVFGFALTLIVVSLEVPKNFAELHGMLRGFLPFGVTFLMLMLVWHTHYKFFRRYGMHDLGTIWLNGTPSKSSCSMLRLLAMWSLMASSHRRCSVVNFAPCFSCSESHFW